MTQSVLVFSNISLVFLEKLLQLNVNLKREKVKAETVDTSTVLKAVKEETSANTIMKQKKGKSKTANSGWRESVSSRIQFVGTITAQVKGAKSSQLNQESENQKNMLHMLTQLLLKLVQQSSAHHIMNLSQGSLLGTVMHLQTTGECSVD